MTSELEASYALLAPWAQTQAPRFLKEKKKHFVLQYFSKSGLDCRLWQAVKTFKICCAVDGWQDSFYGWSGLTNFSHFGLISIDPIIQPFCLVRSQRSHTVLRLRLRVSVRCDTSTELRGALNNESLVSCRKVTRRDGSMSWTAGASAWVQERLGVRWDVLIKKTTTFSELD